jgi:Restriction alleviation protein Lar
MVVVRSKSAVVLPSLLPCPFCGTSEYLTVQHEVDTELVVGQDIDFEKDRHSWMVECELCYGHGPYRGNEEKAALAWNERKIPDEDDNRNDQ